MRVAFDTSVLVAALVKKLPDHRRALECLKRHICDGAECCCSTHTLAECYSTLTSLPLQQRILPSEAAQLLEVNFAGKITVVEIPQAVYFHAIRNVAALGLRSGMIYDALHLACAESASCERIYTFNLKHFQRLEPAGIEVVSP